MRCRAYKEALLLALIDARDFLVALATSLEIVSLYFVLGSDWSHAVSV